MALTRNSSNAQLRRRDSSLLDVVMRLVSGSRGQFKVLQSVVGLVVVLVMNKFGRLKNASQVSFHYKAMLVNVAFRVARMIGSMTEDVAVIIHSLAPFPERRSS